MPKQVDLNQLRDMMARADRVRWMIHARAVQAYHQAFGNVAKPGDTLNMCVIHNSLIGRDTGKPWAEVDYRHMRRAAWLCSRSYEPRRIVDAWYSRKSREG